MRAAAARVYLPDAEAFSPECRGELSRMRRLTRSRGEATAIFVRVGTRVDAAMLAGFPKLRAVFSATTGVDHIDLAACAARSVAIFSLRGRTAFLRRLPNTAEHSFALLLALYRNLPEAFEAVKRGRWEQTPFRGRTLAGKRFGIVGFGRLGRIAASIARGFGMSLSAYDPHVRTMPAYITRVRTLTQLARSVDVLSIYASLVPETIGLIDARVLAAMKPEAVLVNVARGQIVDEAALLDALRRGAIAGAALDVLADEASAGDPGHSVIREARRLRNLIITPHIGGQTFEAVVQADRHILDLFAKWEGGK